MICAMERVPAGTAGHSCGGDGRGETRSRGDGMREIVIDTETTGLDPYDGHRIVEVACVELMHHVPTGRKFHRYVNPDRDMPAEAVAVHGITAEFLKSQPGFEAIADDLATFIGGDRLVIHNAEFDLAVREKHGADIDCGLLAKIYVELLGGRQPGLDFAAAGGNGMPLVLPQDRPRREPRPHAASLDELAAHQAMLALLKAPLWLAA